MTTKSTKASSMKYCRKRVLYAICYLMLTPAFVLYRLRLVGFTTTSQLLSLIPGLGGMWLRRAWYEATLTRCGENLYVDFLAAIRTPKSSVGSNIHIGPGCWLGWVDIGDDVMFGGHNVVMSGTKQHDFVRTDIPMRLQEGYPIQVKIGRDVWVGNGAIIAADIAEGCVVGAGSVVLKPTEPYTIVAGVPARVIRKRGEPDAPERDA